LEKSSLRFFLARDVGGKSMPPWKSKSFLRHALTLDSIRGSIEVKEIYYETNDKRDSKKVRDKNGCVNEEIGNQGYSSKGSDAQSESISTGNEQKRKSKRVATY
jgi:hypothetical protein